MARNLLTLTLGLGVGAILLVAQALRADPAACAARAVVLERLAETYGESRQAIGLAETGQVLELFANLETGSWTVTLTLPSGQMCLLAAGGYYERRDEPLIAGEPA